MKPEVHGLKMIKIPLVEQYFGRLTVRFFKNSGKCHLSRLVLDGALFY